MIFINLSKANVSVFVNLQNFQNKALTFTEKFSL